MPTSKSIIIYGKASQNIIQIIPVPASLEKDISLMEFLRNHNITIASSCGGVGSCKKCLINTDLVSCQISLGSFLEKYPSHRVEISYL